MPPSRYNDLPLDDTSPMRFQALQVGLGSTWVQATGTITRDTPDEFERFLQTNDAAIVDVVFLHSPGGNLGAGLELGRKIRQAGYRTTIGRTIGLEDGIMAVHTYQNTYCFSACAYAFLGGVTRSFGEADLFGVHRFSSDAPIRSDDAQVATAFLAQYLEDMGVGQQVLRLASSAAADDMLLVAPEEAGRLGIIYDASGEFEFEINRLGSMNAALFKTQIRGRRIGGMVACSTDGTPTLVVSLLDGQLPDELKSSAVFGAEFRAESRREPIKATATYLENSTQRGLPTVTFAIPDMTPDMFEGRLELWTLTKPSLGKVDDFESYAARIRWEDAVRSFRFFLIAANSKSTLPVVLDDCGSARPH